MLASGNQTKRRPKLEERVPDILCPVRFNPQLISKFAGEPLPNYADLDSTQFTSSRPRKRQSRKRGSGRTVKDVLSPRTLHCQDSERVRYGDDVNFKATAEGPEPFTIRPRYKNEGVFFLSQN